MGKIHDNLSVILTKKQTEALAKYDDCVNEMYGIIEHEIFTYAFRLGVQLIRKIPKKQISTNKTTLKVLPFGVVYTLLMSEENRLKSVFC